MLTESINSWHTGKVDINHKGFAPILLLVAALAVVGLLAFANLAPFKDKLTTALFPKSPSSADSKTTLETIYNPFGDGWVSKKTPTAQSPGIAVSLGTASGSDPTVPQEQIDFLAKTNAPFLYFDSFGGELKGGTYTNTTVL